MFLPAGPAVAFLELVAELLGCESQAAFSRAFRRWYETTPRAARNQGHLTA